MARERFDYKRLVVYQVSLGFLGWALQVTKQVPPGLPMVVDQLVRAALSIVLNIAEGAGLWRIGNKRKHYEIARGSTFEAAALLDVLRLTGAIGPEDFARREEQLAEIGARLTRLCQRYDTAPNRPPRD